MEYSHTKISHTILEFGRALIAELPDNHSREELEAAMLFIITVWNAVVADKWFNTDKYLKALHASTKQAPAEAQLHIKQLIQRKQQHFANDDRAVGKHWVKEKNGEFIFGCDARIKPDADKLH